MAAVFDRQLDRLGVRPGQHRQRHAIVVNPVRRFGIDEHVRVDDFPGAYRERPVVAGHIVAGCRRIERQDDPDVVRQFLVGEALDRGDAVPEPEEPRVGRGRVGGNRPEERGAEGQDVMAQRRRGAVRHAPVAERRIFLEGFQIEGGQTRVGNRLQVGLDRHPHARRVKMSAADEAAAILRPLELGRPAIQRRDFDAIEVVFEPGVAAAGRGWTLNGATDWQAPPAKPSVCLSW